MSSASQNRTMATSNSGCEQRRRAADPGNDDRNDDRIQQHRQQHVAAARPHEHGGEQRPHRREPDRAGHQDRDAARTGCARSGAWNSSATSGTSTSSTASEQRHDAEQLAEVDGRRAAPAPAAARAASRTAARARTSAPAPACRRTSMAIHRIPAPPLRAPALRARAQRRRPARTTRRRTASCRRSRGCGPRPSGPCGGSARPRARTAPGVIGRSTRLVRRRAGAQAVATAFDHAPVAQEHRLIEQPVGQVEVVRGQDDDARRRSRSARSRATSAAADASSRPVNGSSSSDQPRLVNQRALERDALPHARAKSSTTGSSARASRPGRRSAPSATRAGGVGDAVEPGEERQVLARGQLGIEEEIVAEHADARPQLAAARRRLRSRRRTATVPAVGPQQRGQHRQHRGLAGAVRPEQAEDLAAGCREGDACAARAGGRSGGETSSNRDLVEVEATSRGDALAASLRARGGLVELAVDLLELLRAAAAAARRAARPRSRRRAASPRAARVPGAARRAGSTSAWRATSREPPGESPARRRAPGAPAASPSATYRGVRDCERQVASA